MLQNRDVSVILDRETLQLKFVYTPLAVIEREPGIIKPEEETTIREIESLNRMNIYTRSETVDFEYHLTNYSVNNPEVWTKIGIPGCSKTFLSKYAGYNYGIDNIANFQYLLCIPCRDPEWLAIEVARQEDREINKFIRRWLVSVCHWAWDERSPYPDT